MVLVGERWAARTDLGLGRGRPERRNARRRTVERKTTDAPERDGRRWADGADGTAIVTVWYPMNDHDALTVFLPEKRAFRQVVAYGSPDVRSLFRRLPAGATLTVAMERLAGRGDCWRLTDAR